LGAYLAHELLCRSAATIHALVRCRDAHEGSSRLRERMTQYGLWDDAFGDRIRVVPGDLARSGFGWTPERFDDIAASVDAVYHSGATIDTLSPYRTLKPANVGGTHEALRLASRGPLKPLHFISTLSVTAFEGRREAAPDSSSGYDQTKWVAEELVRRAGAAGLPVTIFRPSAITGDTRTGACNAGDFFHRFLRGCIAFGTCPDIPMSFDCAPVDFVAGQIVDLSARASSIGRTFAVVGERPLQLEELAAHVRANGVPLRKESYDAWRARLTHADNTHPLAPLAPMFRETVQSCGDHACAGVEAAAASPGVTSVTCPVPSRALIGTYITYLTKHRLLDLPTRALATAGSTQS
jgi:thioester reductase-like protein